MTPCDRCDYNGGFRMGLIQYPDCDLTIADSYDILLGSLVDYGEFIYDERTSIHTRA